MRDESLFLPGDRIAEKYIVESELGRGGMAVVVAARHAELGNEVAIKALHPAALKQASAVERLMREARAAAGLRSEHATKVFDVGRLSNGAPFLVLERLRGMDLHALLEARGALSPGQAARAVLQACDAVAEAHEGGIVHRDLKPSNLFLAERRDGTPIVKVLDFGIAKAAVGLEESALTTTSSSLGTPLYMAPEQIMDAKSVTSAVDVWALGVTLYELVSNQIPWDVQNVHALLAKIVTEAPVPLRRRSPEVPAALEAIVMRCLARSPEDRFPSVRALAAALTPLADAAMSALDPPGEVEEPTQVDGAVPLQVADTDVVLRPQDVHDTTTNPLLKQAQETAPEPTQRQGQSDVPARTGFEWDVGGPSKETGTSGPRRRGVVALGVAAATALVVGWLAFRPQGEPSSLSPPPRAEGSAPTMAPPEGAQSPEGPLVEPTSAEPPVVLAAPATASGVPSSPPSSPSAPSPGSRPAGPAPRPSSAGLPSRPARASPSAWGPMK